MFTADYKEKSNLIGLKLKSDGEDDQKASIVFANGTYYRSWYFNKFPIKSYKYKHRFVAAWKENKPEQSYWKTLPREYGFTILDGVLHIYYGIRNSDWTSKNKDKLNSKSVLWYIPWMNMCFINKLVMNDRGMFVEGTDFEYPEAHWDSFLFNDFDGEEITARCFIEKREWYRWTGCLKWAAMALPKIERYVVAISFNKEVGSRKGSWKGGTVGHSIELEFKDESMTAAFKRYCLIHNMTFIKKII